MKQIDFPLMRPCSLKIPSIVRYIDKKHVEDFFRSGSLRLTTYSKCKNHEDSARKDENEGKYTFELEHSDTCISGVQNVGFQSYLLCASMIESETLSEKFNTDCYFIINDVIAFFDAISKKLSAFEYGRMGPCIYKDKRHISKETEKNIIPPHDRLLKSTNTEDGYDIQEEFYRHQHLLAKSLNEELADTAYFLKETQFSGEAEFRLIWTVSHDVEKPFIIECPDAIKFCSTRISLPEIYQKPKHKGDQRNCILAAQKHPPSTE